jgi:hypothetical protein
MFGKKKSQKKYVRECRKTKIPKKWSGAKGNSPKTGKNGKIRQNVPILNLKP